MQRPPLSEDHRSLLLDALVALADLQHRPSALSRVRTFIRDADTTERSAARLLAEALNEVGQAASAVSYKLSRGDLRNVEILAITRDGRVVRIRHADAAKVHADDVITGASLTLDMDDLQGVAGHIDCVELFGASRSFLSSDATLPRVRDAQYDRH